MNDWKQIKTNLEKSIEKNTRCLIQNNWYTDWVWIGPKHVVRILSHLCETQNHCNFTNRFLSHYVSPFLHRQIRVDFFWSSFFLLFGEPNWFRWQTYIFSTFWSFLVRHFFSFSLAATLLHLYYNEHYCDGWDEKKKKKIYLSRLQIFSLLFRCLYV